MTRRLFLVAAAILMFSGRVFASTQPDEWTVQVIASTLVLEANTEGMDGMEAVMCVIQNRAHNNPSKFLSVIRKPKQFSCRNGKSEASMVRAASRHAVWSHAKEIVRQAYAGQLVDVTNGATHYVRRGTRADWIPSFTLVAQIGRHDFYR